VTGLLVTRLPVNLVAQTHNNAILKKSCHNVVILRNLLERPLEPSSLSLEHMSAECSIGAYPSD
jgi:hypothetical protein